MLRIKAINYASKAEYEKKNIPWKNLEIMLDPQSQPRRCLKLLSEKRLDGLRCVLAENPLEINQQNKHLLLSWESVEEIELLETSPPAFCAPSSSDPVKEE